MAVTLLWFKRDLRTADHPALALAAARGRPVVPLYIAEPGLWAQADASGRQWAFVAESLAGLREGLARLGAPLVLRRGDAVEVLAALHAALGVAEIVSHEETGTRWTYARDRAVAAWARGQGIGWVELPHSGVVRRLASRDGWAARRERFVRGAPVPAPEALPPLPPGLDPGAIPSATDLGLSPDPCPGRQAGGRAAALVTLGAFLTERGEDYRRAMSSPLAGATACSRLSPHLAWGTLSVREAVQAGLARAAERPGGGWGASLASFQSRLAWRDHFGQKLEDFPDLDRRCLHPATEALRPPVPDAARLAAWEAGETGLPFVDACIRSLRATGWLNFRMRSMLVSVASYHLWLDWRATGPILARAFTDYDPGIHWSQMQMQSGTTGINTIRLYNPVKQGHDQDPAGTFTRAWVPELAEVPDPFLHEPWRWGGAGRLRYPAPVVDPAEAAKAAKEAVFALRSAPGFRAEAARVAVKHASRKDGGAGRHFVNDRASRTGRKAPSRQLSFDL